MANLSDLSCKSQQQVGFFLSLDAEQKKPGGTLAWAYLSAVQLTIKTQ